MTDRILEILRQKNLSPSQFADEIGVQRSSISHLVSGRNKPSLEFVQKVLNRFPEINTEWMLSGTGPMEKDGVIEPPVSINNPQETNVIPDLFMQETEKQPVTKPVRKKTIDPQTGSIERIVIFYKDKTFREYLPD